METYDISLEEYCENCPEFEVTTLEENIHRRSSNVVSPFVEIDKVYISRKLTCEHRKRCANMVKWLEKSIKNKGENK